MILDYIEYIRCLRRVGNTAL